MAFFGTGGGGVNGTTVLAAAGSVSAPSISFSADTNTGFYNPSADVIGVVVNGARYWQFDDDGPATAVYRLKAMHADSGIVFYGGSEANNESFITGADSGVAGRLAIYGKNQAALISGTSYVYAYPSAISIVNMYGANGVRIDDCNLKWLTDNTADIGSSATAERPRAIYAGTRIGVSLSGAQNAAAAIQVDSTTKGILFPRMTTTEKNAISSPPAGLVVYDTTLNKLCVYTTAWETITSA